VYFPPSRDSPGGFRPVGEGGKQFPLTYTRLKSEQLQPHQQKNPGIRINMCDFLNVHPIVVDSPLIFEKKNPLLLSMIPGPAHHYFKEVTLAVPIFHYFCRCAMVDYQAWELGVAKAFVIDTVKEGKSEVHQCVLFLHPEASDAIYRKEDKFYRYNPKRNEVPIS